MEIQLCVNHSEKNKLNKVLTDTASYLGSLKSETSITNPVVHLVADNPVGYNYAYIPEFNRYYYIDDIVSVRTGLWRISMSVDVLESFKDSILGVKAILSDSEENGAENYLSGEVWRSKVKELTDIVAFPQGLSESGHFILITAGG